MANDHQAQINSANQQINSANSRISDNEYEISILDGKISRLKEVKEIVKSQKQEVTNERLKVNLSHTNVSEWKGSNKDNFQSIVDSTLISGYITFQDNVDTALDEINNAITRLENERLELKDSIGWLWSKINSLFNYIENLTN